MTPLVHRILSPELFCDGEATHIHSASHGDFKLRELGSSIGLVFCEHDGSHFSSERSLVLPTTALRDYEFDGHPLCPSSKSDLTRHLDLPTLPHAGSACRVGERHVLTAAHILGDDISNYYFAFDVRLGACHVHMRATELEIARSALFRGKSIVARLHYGPHTDWALVELDLEPHLGPRPLPPALTLGEWDPCSPVDLLGHPLGLPLMHAPSQPKPSLGLNYRLWVDSGAGMSGAPLIQAGKVVGVMHGTTDYALGVHTTPEGKKCVDLSAPHCDLTQPFTPAARMRAALPSFFTH